LTASYLRLRDPRFDIINLLAVSGKQGAEVFKFKYIFQFVTFTMDFWAFILLRGKLADFYGAVRKPF
jgi:hypothetical protein